MSTNMRYVVGAYSYFILEHWYDEAFQSQAALDFRKLVQIIIVGYIIAWRSLSDHSGVTTGYLILEPW